MRSKAAVASLSRGENSSMFGEARINAESSYCYRYCRVVPW